MFIQCAACLLSRTSRRQVGPDGNPDARLVLVGEAPGPVELKRGIPFIGPAGQFLDTCLAEAGIPREDVLIANTVNCLPPRRHGSSAPQPDEARFCYQRHTGRLLARLRPTVVVLLGGVAARTVLETTAPIGKIRGTIFETSFSKAVIPTWHPSYCLRNSENPAIKAELVADLRAAWQIVLDERREGEKLKGDVELRAGAQVTDKGALIRSLERRPVEGTQPWHPGRKYFAGWSDGEVPVLVYRDETGRKRTERVDPYEWYFFIQSVDTPKLPVHPRLDADYVTRIVPDPRHPAWTRIYARRAITQTQFIKDRGEIGVALTPEKREKFRNDRQLWDLLTALDAVGIEHFEADLTPCQRLMTDYDLEIEDQLRELYFDLETDDSASGFADVERRRILSVSYVWCDIDGQQERRTLVLDALTDEAEARLLAAFRHVLQKSDVLYAWNGFTFDFPILRSRLRARALDYDWRFVIWCDLLAVWRRYFQRAAAVNTSFSLNDIGARVLHLPKLDWQALAVTRCRTTQCQHPNAQRIERIIDLWRWHPDILAEYNNIDVEILYKLEQAHGFAKIDQTFCRIGNTFPNNFHISTKIDMLMLKKGMLDGVHFRTRRASGEKYRGRHGIRIATSESGGRRTTVRDAVDGLAPHGPDSSYVGAYVFEPVIGLHDGVAALDFKSLYPSMMITFNISPDTWVSRQVRSTYAPEALISTPTPFGTTFVKAQKGFIPQIFEETLQKRKVYQALQLEEVIGSDKFLLYYRLSYAFKRLGLSFYGELGNPNSRYFNPEIAEAVTLCGQFFIKETAKFAEQQGLQVLYGDTDSIYIKASPAVVTAFVRQTDVLYRELVVPYNARTTDWIIELEYENYFNRIFFVSKKRYAGLMSMFKGKMTDYLEVKGLEFMRSDGLQFARQLQYDVMQLILRERPAPIVLAKLLLTRLREVLDHRLPVEQVQMTQAIEKDVTKYKTTGPHVRVATWIKANYPTDYYVGMKVPYVLLDSGNEVWSRQYDPAVHTYDAVQLWNRKILPVTCRVLKTVYPAYDWDAFFL